MAAPILVIVVAGGDDTGSEQVVSGCNGSEQLCGRPLDEVVFPATYNSMAAADYRGLLFPMHQATIPQQLEDGIRGLLIDAYYGYPGSRVYTDFERGPNKLQEQIESGLGPDFVAAADRIRASLTRPNGESKLYLCHGFCELGAIDLVDTLKQINQWVVNNPNEVLMITD